MLPTVWRQLTTLGTNSPAQWRRRNTTCSIAYGLPAIAYGLPAHAHLLITCEQAGRAKSGAQTGEASQTVTEAGVQKAHV